MWKVKIKDVHPEIDGEYELDWEFKKKHWRTIKKVADVTPLELVRELRRGNVELSVALVMVALDQAGKPYIEEIFWETEGEMKIEEEEDPDAGPPVVTTQPPTVSEAESSQPASESSGAATSSDGGHSPETATPNGSGEPGSVASSISDHATSAS